MTVAEEIQAEEKLGEALNAYAGEWVAVADYVVVAHAATLEELLGQIEGREEEVEEVFQVSEGNVACFY
jgi:Family of unknown function (DUF5678)